MTTSQRVQTPWQLRADLASARFLLWVASAGRSGELRPEVHLYLYDRYWRLAIHYEQRGKTCRARQLRIKAERHFQWMWLWILSLLHADQGLNTHPSEETFSCA